MMAALSSTWRGARRAGRRLAAQHVGQGQAGAEGADLEEAAAIEAVAELLL